MKRRVCRALALTALLLISLVSAALWMAERSQRPVGFAVGRANNPRAAPFAIAIWYPTSATPWPTTPLGLTLMSVARDGAIEGNRLPVVILSHGNGGSPGNHVDLALALADAGYVVAAPMHTGDNIQDSSGVSSRTFWTNRNLEVRGTIDFIVNTWHGRDRIDAGRIGAFGFSAGGFTVLTTVGGHPDLHLVASHCANKREFVCDALLASNSPLMRKGTEPIEQDFAADERIRAAVLAAPGLGFTFAGGGLQDVRVPIQLWTGEMDRIAPDGTNGAVLRSELGANVEAHSIPGARHASFLAPCPFWGPDAVCGDETSFDRSAFHKRMNAEVAAFFQKNLGR
jgi:predicted dienelactone hydrolase